MIFDVYKKALEALQKRPFRLLGIALLGLLLEDVAAILGGPVFGVGIVVAILLETALAVIFFKQYIKEEIIVDDLFIGFQNWDSAKRILGGIGWMILWIFIWSLIPIVGIVFAVIRTYEYRLTPYILINEPEVSIKDAIKVSKERTMGYKGKMFWADILWGVAVALVILILGCISAVRYIGWVFGVVNVLFILAVNLFGVIFTGLVRAAFYVEIEKKRVGSRFYEEVKAPEFHEAPAAKHCPNCGAVIKETDRFCSCCGAKLWAEETEKAAEPAEHEQPAEPEAPAEPTAPAETGTEEPKQTEE